LDLPKALSIGARIFINVEKPLLYLIYLYERLLHGRYYYLKVVPLYVSRLMRTKLLRKADVAHLNPLNVELARRAKNLRKLVIAVLHVAPFPEEVYNVIDNYIDV